jgi:hypothetical protein
MRNPLIVLCSLLLTSGSLQAQQVRLESLQNKTILLFTPHPDDDVFGAGGTIALLNRNHNKVYIVVYTNDDKGSYDPAMNSQRLAQIRKAEQETSEAQLGTPKENIMWMGYDDGMLEYAPQPKLTEEATAIIRRIRPEVLLALIPASGTNAGIKAITAWRPSTRLTPCAPPSSGSIFPTKNSSSILNPTKFPRCTSFTRRRRRRIISSILMTWLS